jgi:Family of unknown function (DUF5331)
MNVEHFRQSLKATWLRYYRENRTWLTKIAVWVSCEGQRRPSSSFILGTLSILEPQLTQMLPLMVDLSSNPDRIVIALGLNFNPDTALEEFEPLDTDDEPVRMLPAGEPPVEIKGQHQNLPDKLLKQPQASNDEACEGIGRTSAKSRRLPR